MKILVTGADSFLGENLIVELKNKNYNEIYEYTSETDSDLLDEYTKYCNFIFHFAAISGNKGENYDITNLLFELLKKHDNKAPILIIKSTVFGDINNLFTDSKMGIENLIIDYVNETEVTIFEYDIPYIFGKWSNPNKNIVAFLCYNISRGLEIQIDNLEVELTLSYIDDVLRELLMSLEGNPTMKNGFCIIPVRYNIRLEDLIRLIKDFKETRINLNIPNMKDDLTKKLHSTYISLLPQENFSYDLNMHTDIRGSFTEFVRTPDRGQISVNITKPGKTKGNHWHHTKNEKFLVVSGEGLILLRRVQSEKIIEYKVSGDKLKVVDIPSGYIHSIVNIGERDLVIIMWANELFDPDNTDTFLMEV